MGVPTHQRWSTSQRSSSTPAAAHQTPYIFSPLSHLLCQIVVCCPGCLVFPSSVLFVFAWVVHSRFVTALRVRSGFVTALQDSSSQHSSDHQSPFATILVLWTCTYLPHWRFNKEHLLAYCFRVSVMTIVIPVCVFFHLINAYIPIFVLENMIEVASRQHIFIRAQEHPRPWLVKWAPCNFS